MAAKGDYPLPKFHFQVNWGPKLRGTFTEVTGLSFEREVIEYRDGTNKSYTKSKQPGLTKFDKLTLKRGTFEGDFDFYNEWNKTFMFQEGNKTGSTLRRPVQVQLLNENHDPIITWQLLNAWPSKIQSADLKADANEIAIETMEIVHEGLTILEK